MTRALSATYPREKFPLIHVGLDKTKEKLPYLLEKLLTGTGAYTWNFSFGSNPANDPDHERFVAGFYDPTHPLAIDTFVTTRVLEKMAAEIP